MGAYKWLSIASESVNQPCGIHSSTGLTVGSEPFHRVIALMKPTGWAPVLVTEGNAYVIADGDFAVQEAMRMAFKTAFTASVRRVTI